MIEPTKVYLVMVETYIWDGVRAMKPHPDDKAFINRADAEALATATSCETDILELSVVAPSPKASTRPSRPEPEREGIWKDREGVIWRLNQSVLGTEAIMRDTHLLAIIKWAQKKWHDTDAHRRYHTRTMGEYLSLPEPNGEMAQLAFDQELGYWLEPWGGEFYPIEEVFDGLQIPYRELVAEAHSRELNVPPDPQPS